MRIKHIRKKVRSESKWQDIWMLILTCSSWLFGGIGSEWRFFPSEVAAKFDQVKNGDVGAATDSNEFEHKFSHENLFLLQLIAFSPLPRRCVFIMNQGFWLWPEHLQTLQELGVVYFMGQWLVARDEYEKHLSEVIVLYAKNFRQILLDGL